jgi:metacaspase-1
MTATRASIVTYLDELIPIVNNDDEVVFFFSGHGGRGKANDGDSEVTDECIWVHDGNSKLVPIYDGELAYIFNDIATSRVVFIFDSCYAGGMTDLKKDGRVIVMGSGENSLSYEFSNLNNGELTYYLVDRGMINYLADKYNDDSVKGPDVTVEEAWDYAKSNCSYDAITISDSFTNDLLP